MTKKHYIIAARIVYGLKGEARQTAEEAFATMFREDNPRFDDTRFHVACTEGLLKARTSTKYRRAQ